ncbi:MAG: carboxypeptidase regulatory-like domain-containing protein [Acidobacteriaceae bacterium]|nr:carboxypeptidase regulatory-like domain-containing protein [Acidobacteriaceae bacterium]
MALNTTSVFAAWLGLLCLFPAQGAAAQTAPAAQAPAHRATRSTGIVQGTVKDNTGGIIPGAMVTLADAQGTVQTTTTGADGAYTFRGVAPGTYTVSATYSGLQQEGITAATVAAGQAATANLKMTVQTQRQEVTVTDTSTNTVSTEAANNQTALVLKQEDLDALPDDPDDLQADLEALAGPAAGPGGNQIYIDGFTGGRLPPKESIREIRINSNPFSAEFDKMGFGRIQIFTKPGTDKFHGQAYYDISDGIWNSRNPFLVTPGFDDPPFRTQLFGGNFSGPVNKHASFFLDVERRQIDDNGIVNATIPAENFLTSVPYQIYHATPQRRTTVSPRLDYQLGANNTLSLRYAYLENDHILTGVGAFNLPTTTVGNITLPSSGYTQSTNEQTAQVVETAVLSPHAVNETHFEFERAYETTKSQTTSPTLDVAQSFVSGGSGYSAPGYPSSYDLENYWELQNYTSLTYGAHSIKAGIRVRATALYDSSPKTFNGQYSFLGGQFPYLPQLQPDLTPLVTAKGAFVELSSIQQYLYTEQLFAMGKSSGQIAAEGYGPSKYTVNTGTPYVGLTQFDFGPFVQDDWRVKPNLTLSFGLRLEAQTNIPSPIAWAPRFSFAWSPDSRGSNSRPKTVIRGGWGIFYDRFAVTNVLTAERYGLNTNNQVAYTLNNLNNPALPPIDAAFSTPIPIADLQAVTTNVPQHYQIDGALQAPRLMQTAVSLERQLFAHTTFTLNFVNSRGTHELQTVDINAPYPIPGKLPPGAPGGVSGPRPYGNIGDIYNFESDGIFKQTQVIAGVNSQVGKWLTLFTRYSWNNAHSNTDGVAAMPADPYDFAADWGRAALSIEQNFFFGGSLAGPHGFRLSPFLVAHSGIPYNVTTGTDLYLQGQPDSTARPSVVNFTTAYNTPFGYLNPVPLVPVPGSSNIIERNAAIGPGYVGLNVRVSKTWGFGTTKFSGPSGGARSGGGGGYGGGHGGGGFRSGPVETSEHRYNLIFSINVRNILNHENLNTPNGALTSPYFMESTGITGGYGAEATASNQRRIDMQLRFTF